MKTTTKQEKIEKQRKSFFMIGMILALALVFTAFEWKTYDISLGIETDRTWTTMDSDLPPVTIHKKIEPPKVIAPPAVVLKEVDNHKKVVDPLIIDAGADPRDEVPEFIYTPPDDIVDNGEDIPFLVVESMPGFPGGEDALITYLISNTRYTQRAIEAGIKGTVYIGFVVEKDGSISTVTLLRELGGGLDEICMEAIENMPRWTPGKQRGIPVRVTMNVPFNFKLQ